MPELKPFTGIRYSSSSELKDLICPPYDVISADEQSRLYDRHPNNAVRLELARAGKGADRYADAARTYERWSTDGVLTRDPQPLLYVYRQDFTAPDGTRRRVAGVIGALELEPFGARTGVLPHEQTMPGPKEDRLALMRALPVNVSPIYAIFRGGGGLAPFFDALENRPTDARIPDDAGILHRLWAIRAPAEIEMLRAALRPGPLVIADGHHRYETALAFHAERTGSPGDHGSIMTFCVDADVEGLVVLPYHRALRTSVSGHDLIDRAARRFGGRPLNGEGYEPALAASGSDHPLVLVTANEATLIDVTDADVVTAVGERHPDWRALDVVALHEVVLPAIAPEGIDDLTFSKDGEHVTKLVSEGWTAGVLLRAVPAASIVDVARSGERMPQKASYFWPKVVTGLVFHELA